MAGVANIGSDRNWSGSHFNQANWYAFGRLAWDPNFRARRSRANGRRRPSAAPNRFLDGVVPMMLESREAAVDYMTPLGLTHQMATGHHYGPGPWVCDLERPEWNPCYYSRADKDGIGFDRTATGSDALAQYAPSVAALWSDPRTVDARLPAVVPPCPLGLPDAYRAAAVGGTGPALRQRRGEGRTRWRTTWASLKPYVDAERFAAVSDDLSIQQQEARWWRDASIAYWQSVNGLPLPDGVAPRSTHSITTSP